MPAGSARRSRRAASRLQVTGRLAFARGSVTQEGRTVALWSGVCRHVPRSKVMARKDEAAPALIQAAPQTRAGGFRAFGQCQRLFPAHRPVLRAQGARTAPR